MALYWPEARLAVSCTGSEENEFPEETLVILVSPEEATDPSFVETVSYLLAERLEGWKEDLVTELRERGKRVLDPRGNGAQESAEDENDERPEPTEAEKVEEELRKLICEEMGCLSPAESEKDEDGDDGDEEDEGDDESLPSLDDLLAEGYLSCGYGPVPTQGTAIFINHCDELFVRR